MPTSSQAMILRCKEGSERPRFSLNPVPSFPCSVAPTSGGFKIEASSSPRGNCELVKFDFSVSTSGDRSLDGFQGMFAYDQKTKSYRWKICSVLPKSPKGSTEKHCNAMQCGDFINGEQMPKQNITNEDDIEESESFLHRNPSEHTVHFTTPVVSLTDNSNKDTPKNTREPVKKVRYKPLSKPPPLSFLNVPTNSERIYETSCNRLEDLGFRRRTSFMPGGAMVRVKQGDGPLPPPRKCQSESRTEQDRATLTISNLDSARVPKPPTVPYKIQGFQPKPFVTGDSMRKR